MANIVLAGNTLLDFFKDGRSAEDVEAILLRAERGKDRVFLHSASWAEVYFGALQSDGEGAAERIRAELRAMPIETVAEDAALTISRHAMLYRKTFGLRTDDCYAAALAKSKKAQLVSCNPDAAKLEKELKVRLLNRN